MIKDFVYASGFLFSPAHLIFFLVCLLASLHKVFPPSPGTYSQVRSINIIKLRFYFLILFNTNVNCDLSSLKKELSHDPFHQQGDRRILFGTRLLRDCGDW